MRLLFFVLIFLTIKLAKAEGRNIDSVNLFIGTGFSNVVDGVPGGKGGGTQPGAVLPFGMVNFGPDTDAPEQSGYDHRNTFMRGFSLTHLSGPGCRNSGEVLMIPVSEGSTWPNPGIGFTKENQEAHPGYYRVKLANDFNVEITATQRTGFARITPDKASSFTLLYNTVRNGMGDTTGTFIKMSDTRFKGKIRGGNFCGAGNYYDLYFTIELSKPVASATILNGIVALKFPEGTDQVLVKSGISYVSEEGAINNLRTENKSWDFDKVQKSAEDSWEKALATISVGGGTNDSRVLFYTSLYRSLLHPNLASDVNGDYRGMDNAIHTNQTRTHYQNFSNWDIYRTQVQLLSLLFPDTASDIAQSLVDAGSQCGALPKWALNNAETSIMVGDPGSLVLANFKAFGASFFDQQKALKLMLNSAFNPKAACQNRLARPGLQEYMDKGYIPEPTKGVWGPAATTLEYVSADYAVSQFARGLGRNVEAETLLRRSENWKNLFDDKTSLIRPRVADGKFIEPFNPLSLTGFVEGNAYQYTWMIPFDAEGLIAKMGGQEKAAAALDQHMTELNGGLSTPYLYIGNEPCFNTPYLYNWMNKSSRTQQATRRLLVEEFRNSPGGLAGNDDLGALGSFYVWSSIGLFPSIPGVGGFTITSPAFPKIKITPTKANRSITISAEGAEKNLFIGNFEFNGTRRSDAWISVKEFSEKSELEFHMTSVPVI